MTLIEALVVALLIIFGLLFAGSAVLANDDDSALWLARSCAGEAGWGSVESGECAAILHVYRKRAEMHGKTALWIAKRYSAAIKRGGHHRNRWVRHLNRDGTKPKHWPEGAKWSRYRQRWLDVLAYVERFEAGQIVDPVPGATHYGSPIDTPRPGMVRIKTPFRNRFYSVR